MFQEKPLNVKAPGPQTDSLDPQSFQRPDPWKTVSPSSKLYKGPRNISKTFRQHSLRPSRQNLFKPLISHSVGGSRLRSISIVDLRVLVPMFKASGLS